MGQPANQLTVKDLVKKYENPSGPSQEVLKGINLVLSQGDFIALKGPSGSGKSSFLNIIGGLDRPTSGKVTFGSLDLAVMDEEAIADFRLNKLGFVFQEQHLLPQLTVMENILLPTLPKNARGNDGNSCDYAISLLEKFGLLEKISQMPYLLSGGEKQRVAVIRALMNRPEMILADEPTGSLDRENASRIAEMLSEINSSYSATIVMATHSDEIASKAKKIYLLKDGKLETANRTPGI